MNNRNFSVDDILKEVREKRKNGNYVCNKYDFTYNHDKLSLSIDINKKQQMLDKNINFKIDSKNTLVEFNNENKILKESDAEQDTKINILKENNLNEITYKDVPDLDSVIETTSEEKLRKKRTWETNEFVSNHSSIENDNRKFLTHTLNDFFRLEFPSNSENIRKKIKDVIQDSNDSTNKLNETEKVENSVVYVLNTLKKEKKCYGHN